VPDTVDLKTAEDDKPPVDEIDDALVRRVLKAKFGSDDPEAFTARLREADEMREVLPRYADAVTTLTGRLKALEEKPAPRSEPRNVVMTPEEEDERLAEIARTDPYKAIQIAIKKERVNMARMAALAEERGANRAKADTMNERNQTRLAAEWPEAFDEKHELFHTASAIYWNEMSEEQRKSPDGLLSASERAAARIGLPPKSKRKGPAPVVNERNVRDIEAQSLGNRSNKPTEDQDDVELTAADKHRAAVMELDPKVYKQAIAARKAGKNLRYEDKG
jgi:hypothetical protein